MVSKCNLCAELKKDNILYKTDNFFVVPSIGQMGIEGYVLLCSKEHVDGISRLSERNFNELENLITITKDLLHNVYKTNNIVIFEHGPRVGFYRGGGTLDHAHLHIVPLPDSIKLMDSVVLNLLTELKVGEYYRPKRVDDFRSLVDISEIEKVSYFFIQTSKGKRFTTKVNYRLPSQYLKRIVAYELNRRNKWNWRKNPDKDTFKKTIDKLKDKF